MTGAAAGDPAVGAETGSTTMCSPATPRTSLDVAKHVDPGRSGEHPLDHLGHRVDDVFELSTTSNA